MIPLCHLNLHNSSFYTSFPSTVSLATSLPIVVQNLYHTSSSPSELHWTCSFTSLLDIIPKVMDKPNKQIRLWNSTSESIATTNKTIGPNSFHMLSSLITILRVPLPALHPSLPIRVIIRTSRFIRSATLHLCTLVTLSQISTSYTNNSDNTLPMLNVDNKLSLIPDDYRLQISRLEAKFMSRLNSSV